MFYGTNAGVTILNGRAALCIDDTTDICINDGLIRQVYALNAITVVYRRRLESQCGSFSGMQTYTRD
jgi:hypothetical protein